MGATAHMSHGLSLTLAFVIGGEVHYLSLVRCAMVPSNGKYHNEISRVLKSDGLNALEH